MFVRRSSKEAAKRLDVKLKRTAMMEKRPKQASWMATPIWAIFLPLLDLETASAAPGVTEVIWTAPESWRRRATKIVELDE